ncbi:MAG: hypothetical protein ABI584_00640 [Acidobacteriota bacterium]
MTSLLRRGRVVAAGVFFAVLAVRGAYLISLSRTPLSLWHLWAETDEWGYVDWSAHLAAGNWRDVPPWRSYFSWQTGYGSPEVWEGWYQKNAYFSGPLYPYGLAVLRLAFGSPVWPARILQLLLACLASAAVALAVFGIGGGREEKDFLRRGKEGGGAPTGAPRRWVAAAAVAAGLLYGLYGPLVFHDGFLLRDGPVAHLSTLLLVWPLLARRFEENEEKISLKGEEGTAARGVWSPLFLGLLGGAAILLKQTVAPLALASLYCVSSYSPSKKSPGGAQRRSLVLYGLLGLSLPISLLCIRNVSAGVPPLTFDTRQAIGLVWGNAEGADGSTSSPASMGEILAEAKGSTLRTARLVLESYREAPLGLPKLVLKKFATFWNAFEVPDNANFYFFRDRLRLLRVLPVFSCLLGVGLVGLFGALSRGVLRKEEGALAAVAILVPLAACLLVQTTSRYRAAMAGPLALGAGLFLLFTFKEIQARRFRAVCLLALTVGALSLLPLLPSTIPAGHHRFADALVYATLVEAKVSPAAGAAEIDRYLAEGADDRDRDTGVGAARAWLESGDRSNIGLMPEGVAPKEQRFRKKD